MIYLLVDWDLFIFYNLNTLIRFKCKLVDTLHEAQFFFTQPNVDLKKVYDISVVRDLHSKPLKFQVVTFFNWKQIHLGLKLNEPRNLVVICHFCNRCYLSYSSFFYYRLQWACVWNTIPFWLTMSLHNGIGNRSKWTCHHVRLVRLSCGETCSVKYTNRY